MQPIAFRHQRPGFALGLVAAQAAVNSVAFHFAFQLRSFGTCACSRRQRSTFPDSIKVRNGTRRRRAEQDAPRLVCVPVLSCSAAFLWPPYKPITFHQSPAFEHFDLDVVELLAAVRGDVAFFIEKEETT